MSAVCVIPAKGHSNRIPRKNIRLFHGKPIIAYSIEVAQASGLFDEIVVSSDDDEILNIAQSLGASRFLRDKSLTSDEVGTLEVTGDVARARPHADHFCCIYATAPMLLPSDIYRGHRTLICTEAAHCVSVAADPLRDAAQFYWSVAHAARGCEPYYEFETAVELIPANRVCDINTIDDWLRAESMYAALHKAA